MAYLEGTLAPQEKAALEAHLQECDTCRAEYEHLQELDSSLFALADTLVEQTPTIDLVDAVMKNADPTQLCDDAILEDEARMMAYIEAESDEAESTHIQTCLSHSPAHREEVCALTALHQELQTLAQALPTPPAVDLVDGVCQRARQFSQEATEDTPETYSDEEAAEIATLEKDLQALGDSWTENAPEVDLVDAVMQTIQPSVKSTKGNIVSLRNANKRRFAQQSMRRSLLAIAACALLAIALGFTAWQFSQAPAPVQMAKTTSTTPSPALSPTSGQAQQPVSDATPSTGIDVDLQTEDTPADDTHTHDFARLSRLTLKDTILMRRQALLENPQAVAQLGQWASLTPAEARTLLTANDLSTEAVLGALQFLPIEEANALLRAAVAENPDDPMLRYALAKNYASDPAYYEESLEQLSAWKTLDTENSMPLWMEAKLRFENGQDTEALEALAQAALRSGTENYALDAARQRQQTLEASGMSQDAAQFLAATYAGSDEYTSLTQLGQQLLQYGKAYETDEQPEAASEIYHAVATMGQRIADNATLSNEQLAGYDIGMAAITALEDLYAIFTAPENQSALQATYNGILTGLNHLSEIITAYNEVIATSDEETLANIANRILAEGDLPLAEE